MTFPLVYSVAVPSNTILKLRGMLAKFARKVWDMPESKAEVGE